MAQSKHATEKALQKLSDQLTCSVCLDNYREPRVLPCLHAFCKMCLKRLVSRDGTSLTVEEQHECLKVVYPPYSRPSISTILSMLETHSRKSKTRKQHAKNVKKVKQRVTAATVVSSFAMPASMSTRNGRNIPPMK